MTARPRRRARRLIVTLLAFLTASSAWAQAPVPPADAGAYPEPVDVPRYLPAAVVAPTAMVSSAHPLASRAGVEILRSGGNAVDAAVAVQLVLNVVEPQSSGVGGGCFFLYYDSKTKTTHFIDGRETAPAAARRDDFLDARGRLVADPLLGGAAVGVPGTVAALTTAHTRWGKLPLARVVEPAVRLAEDGVGVTPRFRVSVEANRSRFLLFPSSKRAFLHDDGSVPELGSVRRQPDLARTLRLLAEKGPGVFYDGEVAADIVAAVGGSAVRPGHLTLDDLKRYRPIDREPVRFSYRGYEIVGAPPPSSGGITVGILLSLLEACGFADLKPGSVEEADLLARAGAVAFADRNAYLGDPEGSPQIAMRSLLNPDYLRGRAEAARALRPGEKAKPGPLPSRPPPAGDGAAREGDHTSHFSLIDAERNVVSCTTTIEHGMGCGLVVPGRGFLLNNELTDFDLERADGPNALAPGRRPRSSMAPVIVFKEGKPILSLGSPGGPLIIGVVAQVLANVLDRGMDVQQAINAPRLASRNRPLALEVLYPNRKTLEEELRRRGWAVEAQRPWYEAWGGAHAVRVRSDGTLEGGADPRREGAARGY